MARIHFEDLTKDDGTLVWVNYTVTEAAGAPGARTVSIVDSRPWGEAFFTLCDRMQHLVGDAAAGLRESPLTAEEQAELQRVEKALAAAAAAAALTHAERRRMEQWLVENHVDEPEEDLNL